MSARIYLNHPFLTLETSAKQLSIFG